MLTLSKLLTPERPKWYRVFLKKVLHKREEKKQEKNEDNLAER